MHSFNTICSTSKYGLSPSAYTTSAATLFALPHFNLFHASRWSIRPKLGWIELWWLAQASFWDHARLVDLEEVGYHPLIYAVPDLRSSLFKYILFSEKSFVVLVLYIFLIVCVVVARPVVFTAG